MLNTRGDLAWDPEVFALLLSLADHRLVLVQVTAGLPEGAAGLLEPGAPPPGRRLDALEALAEHSVPVVARVQPLVPGLEEGQLRVTEEALERGAQGLIAEPLRETCRGLEAVYRLPGLGVPDAGWEPYRLAEEPGREPLLHPGAGLARWYRPGRGCCLEWPAVGEPVLVRPTLHEYLYWREELGGDGSWSGFEDYVCGLPVYEPFCTMLDRYPSPVRRALHAHHRGLRSLVENPSKLAALLGRLAV